MDDEAGGLFNIAILDSESEDQTASTNKSGSRTDQSEADYQAVKQTYHAKIENGEIHENVSLPVEKGARKLLIQEVMYASEELYYFRRYEEAAAFLDKALAQGSAESEAFDDETRSTLLKYRQKCEQKLANKSN